MTNGLIMIVFLVLSACSSSSKQEESVSAREISQQVKEQWQKVDKPLEIEVLGRSKEELSTIGCIGVAVNGKVHEFQYHDSLFVCKDRIMVDSTVIVKAIYPYRPDMLSDSLFFDVPMPEILIGKQTETVQSNDKIIARMKLNDISALLRIKLESDNLTDVLTFLSLSGDFVTNIREPNDGMWVEVRIAKSLVSCYRDVLLNSGRDHTFNLMPSETPTDLGVTVSVEDKNYTTEVELPPLRPGSVTELHLRISDSKLSVVSSWVDTEHDFMRQPVYDTPEVEVGQFLQSDGLISKTYNKDCIALVIETDGRHGKAVSLTDNDKANIFYGSDGAEFANKFETIDGKHNEGLFFKSDLDVDHNQLLFSPKASYPRSAAFSLESGADMMNKALASTDSENRLRFMENRLFPTAYVPSVKELALLGRFISKNEEMLPEQFDEVFDFYITCCEYGDDKFFTVNPWTFAITGYNSKMYTLAKLRLFYLF